jgi:hypothetical protein
MLRRSILVFSYPQFPERRMRHDGHYAPKVALGAIQGKWKAAYRSPSISLAPGRLQQVEEVANET